MSSINNSRQQQPLVHPINTGTILSDTSLDDHLIGKPPAARVINSNLHDGLTQISAFLRQHQFLSSSARNDSENGGDGSSSSTAGLSSIYGPMLDDFVKSQFERQAAGLRTNTNGASAASVKKVVDCHKMHYNTDLIPLLQKINGSMKLIYAHYIRSYVLIYHNRAGIERIKFVQQILYLHGQKRYARR